MTEAKYHLHREAERANWQYIHDRGKLIPFAEKVANEAVGELRIANSVPDEIASKWNFVFHAEMERLVRQHGIVK